MDKQEQQIMDEFINRYKGVNELGAADFSINGVKFNAGEFEKRAKELGWVSGFKWGVEYPTNGKRPELADDVLCNAVYQDGERLEYNNPTVKDWAWSELRAFYIIDPRYKPKEPESQSKPNSSWHDRGELPPHDSECEYSDSDFTGWRKCKYIGVNTHGSKKYAVLYDSVKKEYVNPKICAELKFRPIKTQREKFVEAALDVVEKSGSDCDAKYITALYEAGFKAPDEKSSK